MDRVATLLLIMVIAIAGPSAAEPFEGRVAMVDGDTLRLDGVTVRLFGIDAPERDQTCRDERGADWPCGVWAQDAATTLFDGKTAQCVPVDIDRYGRIVAQCQVGAKDIGATLVALGAAFAYRRYSERYVIQEASARDGGLGVHRGGAARPEAFRRAAQDTARAVAPPGCRIKGNISDNGRIYHMPGQRFYDRTRIAPQAGERWFCSEREARAAGWRAARL